MQTLVIFFLIVFGLHTVLSALSALMDEKKKRDKATPSPSIRQVQKAAKSLKKKKLFKLKLASKTETVVKPRGASFAGEPRVSAQPDAEFSQSKLVSTFESILSQKDLQERLNVPAYARKDTGFQPD